MQKTGLLVGSGVDYAESQQELRNLLGAPDKAWKKRIAGTQHQVRVFTDGDSRVLTLDAPTLATLKARTDSAGTVP